MLKKYSFIVGLSLAVLPAVYADTFSASKKDFNDQVMAIMKEIENNPIRKASIGDYLDHIKTSDDVKQAVKSNIERHIRYSDFHKESDGIYLCNTADNFHSQCVYFGNDRGFQCAYTPKPITCHSLPPHPGPDKSNCKP